MEKYYVGKLANWPHPDQQQDIGCLKLVEIHFSRRPPTFGCLYLAKSTPITLSNNDESRQDNSKQQAALLLAALNVTSDNTAKLEVIKQILLDNHLFPTNRQGISDERHNNSVVYFDTYLDGAILIEGSLSNEQQLLESICLVLTQAGDLLLISLIDCQVKCLVTGKNIGLKRPLTSNSLDRRRAIFHSRRYDDNNNNKLLSCRLESPLAADSRKGLLIHVLSEKYYQCFIIEQLITNGNAELLYEYWLDIEQEKSLRLTRFHLAGPKLVLIELSDRSIRIIKRSKCIFSGHLNDNKDQHHPTINQLLVLTSDLVDQQTIILSCGDYSISCHSLLVDDDDDDDNNDTNNNNPGSQVDKDDHLHEIGTSNIHESRSRELEHRLFDHQRRKHDPDGLLPQEPSFELEKCWSLDLNDIDSIRSLSNSGDQFSRLGCLCPVWSTNQLSNSSWPKFLLVALKYHILIYSFEQQDVLPFSVIYDKAFLKTEPSFSSGDGEMGTNNKQNAKQNYKETIDLRLQPQLLHNFKLIGPQPTDSLVNTLFLVNKITITQTKQFNQLGLLISLTNLGDLLAFKLTSKSMVVKQKDNLYQQLLLDSIRTDSLLRDEINRIQGNNKSLRDDIANLSDRSHLTVFNQEKHMIDNLERMLQVQLIADHSMGGLYQIELSWSNLILFSRILIVITSVHSYIPTDCESNNPIGIQDDSHIVKSIKILNEPNKLKSTASIELHNKHENVNLKLPVLISDGLFGQLEVYFNLSSPAKATRLNTTSGLISEDLLAHDGLLASRNLMKYYKKAIPIKPLISYQSVSMQNQRFDTNKNEDLNDTKAASLELKVSENEEMDESESIGQFQLINYWLGECLPINNSSIDRLYDVQSDSQDHQISDNVHRLKLESMFTHCDLIVISHPNEGSLKIESNDFKAMNTIKKHLLGKATDQSIRLNVVRSKAATIDNLSHLIGQQRLNLLASQAGPSLQRRHTSKLIDRDGRDQSEMLLESLLNESELDSHPIEEFSRELFRSVGSNWLEKSFRQDLEKLDVKMNLHNSDSGHSTPSKSTSPNKIYKDLICGFIIDTLVEYEQLPERKLSTQAIRWMYKYLVELLDTSLDDLTKDKFVDEILSHWNKF